MNDFIADRLIRERHRDFHQENVHHARAAEMRRSLRSLESEIEGAEFGAASRLRHAWFARWHLHLRPRHLFHHARS